MKIEEKQLAIKIKIFFFLNWVLAEKQIPYFLYRKEGNDQESIITIIFFSVWITIDALINIMDKC